MATLISCSDGNFTSASTWRLVDQTSMLQSLAYTVSVGTSWVNSQTFSPGAITVDGVAVLFSDRNANPGTNTVTISLYCSTDSQEVANRQVRISGIQRGPGWQFFKFDNPVTLASGKSYLVRAICSMSSGVTLYRDSTSNNICRMLRTTTNQAPAAGDQWNVLGEWTGLDTLVGFTVDMDNNSDTSYGPTVSGGPPFGATIGQGCMLKWKTDRNTKLVQKGVICVFAGGTLAMGTISDPVPSSYTAELVFDCVSNVDSGMDIYGDAIFVGSQKKAWTLLAADANAGATQISVEDCSDWAVGDSIVIIGTRRAHNESELRTISGIGQGGAITLSSALGYPHSGTSPYQAEVLNLTRNVKVYGKSSSLGGFIIKRGVSGQSSSFTVRYASFRYFGSGTSARRGIQTASGSSSAAVDIALEGCVIYDFTAGDALALWLDDFYGTAQISYLVVYNTYYGAGLYFNAASPGGSITDSVCACQTNGSTFDLGFPTGTTVQFLRNRGVSGTGSYSNGMRIVALGKQTTFSDCVAHSNRNHGIVIAGDANGCIANCMSWRNGVDGIRVDSGTQTMLVVQNYVARGNAASSFGHTGGNFAVDGTGFVLKSCSMSGETSYSSQYGVYVTTPSSMPGLVQLVDCDLTGSGTGLAPHTVSDIHVGSTACITVRCYNCKFGASQFVGNPSNLQPNFLGAGVVASWRHNQTEGLNGRVTRAGQAWADWSVYRTSAPSERLQPSSSTYRMASGTFQVPLPMGKAASISVWVRASNSFNGTSIRLMQRTPETSPDQDVQLCALTSIPREQWLRISASLGPYQVDRVIMVYVDCDGTAGTVHVDEWNAELS